MDTAVCVCVCVCGCGCGCGCVGDMYTYVRMCNGFVMMDHEMCQLSTFDTHKCAASSISVRDRVKGWLSWYISCSHRTNP